MLPGPSYRRAGANSIVKPTPLVALLRTFAGPTGRHGLQFSPCERSLLTR